jgi:hypothetical protein
MAKRKNGPLLSAFEALKLSIHMNSVGNKDRVMFAKQPSKPNRYFFYFHEDKQEEYQSYSA